MDRPTDILRAAQHILETVTWWKKRQAAGKASEDVILAAMRTIEASANNIVQDFEALKENLQ